MYVDGFVFAVPNGNREKFRAYADATALIFREHGATRVVECWGDDVPDGKVTSFPMAVKKAPDETVVFAWVAWPDKVTRDKGMPLVMADPRSAPELEAMPFDGKRVIFGGFDVIVDR